ncbi:BaiN/RdsA family NAD(P)/FAD-dependent oxidoreductase [Crocinitomix catalasitica]|uniref:NAD(P)/FAD-dependent oxidoreductase n=1 Tax=Crocinitomix catalasitica TaxID=184607 RepID=UPI0004875510|nr:NAD(P)/FAD-dependent oxidoreductase [Crocinitomix catalasitica]
MRIAVIGGGAAGFFSAIHAKENHPIAEVTILEKSKKLLSKVKISGGGRCNVTNGTDSLSMLAKAYPRGEKQLKKIFPTFSNKDTIAWFEARGVPLVKQPDGCIFPKSQNSQSIIDCFLKETKRLNISVRTETKVKELIPIEGGRIRLQINESEIEDFDKVIVATGGSPKKEGLLWLEQLGHEIIDPVPSLFTFNMPDEDVKSLMGIVVDPVQTKIEGTKLKASGPLLITHWGMSGPAVLILSAFGARLLSKKSYEFKLHVNWFNDLNEIGIRREIDALEENYPKKILQNIRPLQIPDRLWQFLLTKGNISSQKKWEEIGKKDKNKLVDLLFNDVYRVKGKTTFKEEFVTCGGVSLNSIDCLTMQSKIVPNLYFAGEVMDIDGITGGYNFQAAWTTGFFAAKLS